MRLFSVFEDIFIPRITLQTVSHEVTQNKQTNIQNSYEFQKYLIIYCYSVLNTL